MLGLVLSTRTPRSPVQIHVDFKPLQQPQLASDLLEIGLGLIAIGSVQVTGDQVEEAGYCCAAGVEAGYDQSVTVGAG